MYETVRVFKCPCNGNKYKLAGRAKDKPTRKEKNLYSELITLGCTVINIKKSEFQSQGWEWCNKH